MPSEKSRNVTPPHIVMPWSEVSQPGAYVCNDTGRLYRIPSSALKEGHSPLIGIAGPDGDEVVTCISREPFTPIEKLRLLAANADIQPQF